MTIVHFKVCYAGISYKDILEVSLEEKEQIFEKKEKSVIGRALLGGLLLGPVGAVVGGMTGLKSSYKKIDLPEMFLSIRYRTDNDAEGMLIFTCKYKDKKDLIIFFNKVTPNVFTVY